MVIGHLKLRDDMLHMKHRSPNQLRLGHPSKTLQCCLQAHLSPTLSLRRYLLLPTH